MASQLLSQNDTIDLYIATSQPDFLQTEVVELWKAPAAKQKQMAIVS